MVYRWNIYYKNHNINSEFNFYDSYGNILYKEPKTKIKDINVEKIWEKLYPK